MDGKFFAFALALVAFATFATLPGAEAQSASSKRKIYMIFFVIRNNFKRLNKKTI